MADLLFVYSTLHCIILHPYPHTCLPALSHIDFSNVFMPFSTLLVPHGLILLQEYRPRYSMEFRLEGAKQKFVIMNPTMINIQSCFRPASYPIASYTVHLVHSLKAHTEVHKVEENIVWVQTVSEGRTSSGVGQDTIRNCQLLGPPLSHSTLTTIRYSWSVRPPGH